MSEFTDAEYDSTDLTTTLTNLKPSTSYEVQVCATSDEGSGAWSDSGSGATDANVAPVFTSAATFEVKENNTTVGAVSANDEDSDDSITGYAITGGTDQEQFEITDEGALSFNAAPNYEVPADVESADPANAANNNEYIVEVTATGGASERVLTAAQTIVVTVSDKDDEVPGQVETPVVSEATLNSMKVTWEVPANTGPEITDYDVQYKASDDDGFTDADYDGTDLTMTLTNLKPSTSYEVQVCATSDEGSGAWSDSGSGTTDANVAPVFTSNATFEMKENNTTVGAVSANDEDSDDSITGYAITGGTDQEQFQITDEGALSFNAAPNYEVPADVESADPANAANNNEYIVEVTATGGASERVLTAAQTITVTVSDKDDEVPGQVETPVVSEATLNSLKVTWTAPANTGPEITDYDVQYKASSENEFTDADYDGTDLTMTLTNLKPGTSYEVQVRATSDEGSSAWSDSGSGMTIENQAPVFTSSATFEVKENNTTVGAVSANDEDSDDSITGYAITGGADQEQFQITDEGALSFKAAPNYEVPADVESADPANAANNNEYIVEVTATGGASERVLTAAQTITVTVSDKDDEAPGQPAVPTVAEATMNSLKVTWEVPANTGPEITDYNVQYKASGESEFTDADYDGTDLTMTLTNLKPSTSYEVQVCATSEEGTGEWSESSEGKTEVNAAPVFTSNATFNVLENVTGVAIVVANDADSDDSVTGYAITGGSDQTKFEITDEGVLRFKAAPDYEMPLDADINNAYIVEVTATSGEDGRALTVTQTITVTVTDIGPPELDAPTVTQVTATTLTITWGTSSVLNTDNVSLFNPIDVALDIAGNKMYWTDSGKIRRADLDGENVEDLIRDAVQFPMGIALDIAGNKMYWVDLYTDKVQRADLNGENIEDLITGLPGKLGGIALDILGNKMYWTDSGSIRRADLDGENVEDLITGLPDKFGGIALDILGNKMYWAIGDRIRRADLNGENIEDLVITGLLDPFGIALDIAGNKMYWADRGTDKIRRADLNGRNVEDLIATGLLDPIGIALDSARDKLYWTETGGQSKKIGRIDLDFNYDIQYRIIDTAGFISANYTGEDLTMTLTDLEPDTRYEVQVRATSDEGTGAWSDSGEGMTIENQAPVFTSSATFEVKENNTTVGAVSANDEDSDDSITGYAITGGTDQEQFQITDEGALSFNAAPNYEVPADVESADPANAANNNEYIVEVMATGGASERVLTAAQTITVTVTDKDDEAPGQVETPVVSEATLNSLKVTWTAPANTGPEITDYDVQYKASSESEFTDAEYDSTDLTTTLTNLKPGTSYEVQVRATSDEGSGAWSDSGEGKMQDNAALVFTSNATFNVLENVTGVGIVVVNDADSDDSVTSYAITGGADQTQFSIFSETGVLIFKAAPDFEAPLDADTNNAYIVEVTATSGENGRALTATQTITVIVTDIGPPEKLDAPTVTQTTGTTLTITWENTSVVLNTDNVNVSIFSPIDVALDLAGNKMYWTDSGSIRRADLDGENVEDLIATGLEDPYSIALDILGDKLYWTDSGSIRRADLNGENIEDLITGQSSPGSIALDIARNKMYWMGSGSIRRADFDGENVEDLITGLPDKFGGIALDILGNKMYWALGDRIRRADLDGTNIEDLVTTGLVDPLDIALDLAGNKMYWTDSGSIRRADLNGRNVEDLIATGLEDPYSIALDSAGDKLYWTEIMQLHIALDSATEITQPQKIGRIDLDLNYDIQYRIIDTVSFINANYTGEDLTTTLTDLKPGTSYVVQVRATNAEGTGDWSEFLSVETKLLFSRTTTPFLVNENRVHAGFLGDDRNIQYSIVGGQDGHLFTISEASMLRFKSAPDYERPLDADGDNAYVIDIRVQESYSEISSQSSPQQILVEVTDVDIPLTPPNVEISQHALSSITVNRADADLLLFDDQTTCFVPHISNGNNFLYWGDSAGNIHRHSESLDDHVVVSGLEYPTSLALDPTSEKIYWADPAGGKIQRADLDGSNVEDIVTFNPLGGTAFGRDRVSLALDLDNGKVYWTNIRLGSGRAVIRRANLDGSSPEDFISQHFPSDQVLFGMDSNGLYGNLAVFDGTVYSRADASVVALNVNGGPLRTLIRIPYIGDDNNNRGDIAVSNGKIYWADNTRQVIRRANVDSSNVEDIVSVGDFIDKIFFDQTTDRLYWTIRGAGGVNFLDDAMDVRYRVSNGENFVINEISGLPKVISGLTPGETYDIQARISNKEGKSEWSPFTQVLMNQSPEFPFESVQWTVRNHSPASPDFDTDVSAHDNDNDPLTYTHIGADADDFIFDPSIGRVHLKSSLYFDFDREYFDSDVKSNYEFSLVVTDGKGGSDTLDVAIHVSDISNNPPYYDTALQPLPIVFLVYDNGSISTFGDNSNVYTNVFKDADGDNLKYSLRGQEAHRFELREGLFSFVNF